VVENRLRSPAPAAWYSCGFRKEQCGAAALIFHAAAAAGAIAMKHFLLPALCLLAVWFVQASGLHAQAVDTTVCAVIKDPKSFDGKIVRIKATAAVGFDQFILKDGDCGAQVNGIWLDYPAGTKGKAGPAALLELAPAHNFAGKYTAPARTDVTLEKSKDFKQFDSWLAQSHVPSSGSCLGCSRYEVAGTFVGRLDGVADATVKRDANAKVIGFGGFGNMNAYAARLVLQSVSDVQRKEVDYSSSETAMKSDQAQQPASDSGGHDPIAAAEKVTAGLGDDPGSAAARKDAAAYGKEGEHNGVEMNFGPGNEAASGAAGTNDSPDGVLYNCTFNMDRLHGSALSVALVHIGQHINDIRSMTSDEYAPAFGLEYNAWVVTLSTAVGTGNRYVTLPGGELLFAVNWPAADRESKIDGGLTSYLSKDAVLTK
jgi:hypothetical protein